MENYKFVEDLEKNNQLKLDSPEFKINFLRAILLSLLEKRVLTQVQFDLCMDKVKQKYLPCGNIRN